MSDNTDAETDEEEIETAQASSNYKILGEFDPGSDGAGVLGRNMADSGVPIGVEGVVPGATDDGFGLATPHNARIEGIVDTNESEFIVETGNTATGTAESVVLGHTSNTVDGAIGATISGGGLDPGGGSALAFQNTVSGDYGTVGGGLGNDAGAQEATVAGGRSNTASGENSTVGGGEFNTVKADYGTIAGGGPTNTSDQSSKEDTKNVVYDNYGTIGGGGNNEVGTQNPTNATYATVGGGKENRAVAENATIGGGDGNEATAENTTIAGGRQNKATANGATVSGGTENEAQLRFTTVCGGIGNVASNPFSTVLGGRDNTASDRYSFAAGHRAKSTDQGSFVWSDSRDKEFSSNGRDQFIVDADGGVGLGTNTPRAKLHAQNAAAGTASDEPTNHVAVVENTADEVDGVDATNANMIAIVGGPTSDPGADVNFINFYDGNGDSLGVIEGDGNGGVTQVSSGSDYAEYLPLADPETEFDAGSVVGVDEGELVADAAGADRAMVVSDQPIVTGNSPGPEPEDRDDHETVAFVGQVPVKVRGPVEPGDLIVPSGGGDGTAIAISADDWQPGDGPLIGRTLEGNRNEAVTEVTVAVGIDDPTVLEGRLADYCDRLDNLEADNECLHRESDETGERIDTLERKNEQLRRELAAKDERIDDLEARLASVEATLGTDDPLSADD